MMNKFSKILNSMHANNKINDWQLSFYKECVDENTSSDFFNDLISDHQDIKSLEIDNENEYNKFQDISILIESSLYDNFDRYKKSLESNHKDNNLSALKQYVFNLTKEDSINLDKISNLIDGWVKSNFNNTIEDTIKRASIKLAYPNIHSWIQPDPLYDIEGKWINTLNDVYRDVVKLSITINDSFKKHTSEWPDKEAEAFKRWAAFYARKDHQKYSSGDQKIMHKKAFTREFNPPDLSSMQEQYQANKEKEEEDRRLKKERMDAFDRLKKSLDGRLNSARKVLTSLQRSISEESYDRLSNTLFDLLKYVHTLKFDPNHPQASFALLENQLIKAANICKECGYGEGFLELNKFAKDISSENGLTKWAVGNIMPIVELIEQVDETLKSRDLVRTLMRADIALSDQGMASYFPELSAAIARLSEAFDYSGNKTSEVLSRLRGTEREKALRQKENIRVNKT